ncbi:bifunctional 4-hydroxy-2-oxoglutarate aldolase/2-dehydro-3-deoxy-phosphogluconate aldolase [Alicyclobacillus macrosporangiidus]|jgi:2-dehydro-3-deoxyphosphogluconate aldolase/(4S)-4-hydroxy-2-oxoglutarate aldolase|uniref:2-dehydro-3-deoxyphosphogluconate aldolase / (4S)-4-hydroxy-2-oxoglutarate aldolase n=1 Tax=Alicyclobacillus macrosporangiidus TaxID=392015 RepID=A0A1I7IZH9_9BACL|nr:bifunctional 4-hydroxy-2-oxoglutarate aldolase/2-dehydro-3-deoxy-phosphogluconate aldolase [Alicyclobacillus macrosporangiidus]SFU78292.1 2-dehydro-3-deoxyphosphogluconate aldolase / (4S)-4-hydroxy-2-oxoglutarate aldolase [Alicyclobacillus macrosporangiidus]
MNPVLERLCEGGVVAIFRRVDRQHIQPLVEAVVKGGVRAVELTVDSDGAYETIRAIRDAAGADLLVGAGTLMEPEQVDRAVEAGADFLLSPHLDVALLARADRLGAPFIPGVTTPTEIVQARRAGAQVLKLFPAGPLGPAYLKDLLGPFRGVAFLPTGGITPDNAPDYIRAGAPAVGMGSALVDPADVAAGRWEAVTTRVRALVDRVQAAKRGHTL